MSELTIHPLDIRRVPNPSPPRLTYAQALIRWPRLFRESNGQFKRPILGKDMYAVEHRSAWEQPQFGIAGLNKRDSE
jgi:hypothetical protein